MRKIKKTVIAVTNLIITIAGIHCISQYTKNSGSPELTVSNPTQESTLVPLDINLPKPMFVSWPRYKDVPNLEEPFGKPRPPFLAPHGTKNVALGKSVSSTDTEPVIGSIEKITDGRKEGIMSDYIELHPGLQRVTIDLGNKYALYAIVFWHNTRHLRVYYDVIVQVADDPEFTANVRTLFNNDIDNSAGLGAGKDMHYVETSEGKLIDANGTIARYVRLYSNGNSANEYNHYAEVEVYGKPAESSACANNRICTPYRYL